MTDLLADAVWQCTSTAPGALGDPADLDRPGLEWLSAAVPGTAGQALIAVQGDSANWFDYDGRDWWYRATFAAPADPGAHELELEGLATIADVWLNGELVLHSENMFLAHRLEVGNLGASNELVIRCAALTPVLNRRWPRPRWRSPRLVHQNLRWIRTSLFGRLVGWVVTPPPVGPWRPITLRPTRPVELVTRHVLTSCTDDGGGVIDIDVVVRTSEATSDVSASCREAETALAVEASDGTLRITGRLVVPTVERWWPHTHGAQPLYPVSIKVGNAVIPLGRVGFRTLEVDRSDGGFTLVCNGVPIFARGACWTPPDPVAFTVSGDRLRRNLELYLAAGFNLVRLVGEISYETEEFLDRCDELGLLLWQDAMFAFYDAPVDDAFAATLAEELGQVFRSLSGRPCLAVICGGSDTEEQGQFMGRPPEGWRSPVAYELIPALIDQWLPGTPYIASSPGESPLPTMINEGVAHYYGVGAYTRPIGDCRRAAPRFVAECLSFATPPEPLDAVEPFALPRAGMGHHQQWKNAIHSDSHASWDQEDVREFYTKEIFGIDLFRSRHQDPDHTIALARATSAQVFDTVLTEWRRPGSPCAGSVVFHWHDLRYGAGLGLIDHFDRPKSSWYAARRVMQPVTILLTDEGLNGLALHVLNDLVSDFEGSVRLELVVNGELRLEPVDTPVVIPARSGSVVETAVLFGGFRDLSYAHQFGKPAYDAVVATLFDRSGEQVGQAVFLPALDNLSVEPDVGLDGVVRPAADGGYEVEVTTCRLAYWVSVEVPGYVPLDGWFHLPPGEPRVIPLLAQPDAGPEPKGTVRAVNSARVARLPYGPAR